MSEFTLIEDITRGFLPYKKIHTGAGDDAAVRQISKDLLELYTVDTLVENDHFTRSWSTPDQIGMKAIEVNVSDIVAMGGTPIFLLSAVVLSSDVSEEWVHGVYAGMQKKCAQYGITLLGGDTTHGAVCMISITMLGECLPSNLCLRKDAQIGDSICVTGTVGGSTAGYLSLRAGKQLSPYIRKRHLEPTSRYDIVHHIAPLANAMIDVSDGVGSEVQHIASQSQVGAILSEKKLPVHPDVLRAEKNLGIPKYSCALSGGEDFELLFTIPPRKYEVLQKLNLDITPIGTITADSTQRSLLSESGEQKQIPGGYDHLSPKE